MDETDQALKVSDDLDVLCRSHDLCYHLAAPESYRARLQCDRALADTLSVMTESYDGSAYVGAIKVRAWVAGSQFNRENFEIEPINLL